MASSNQLGTLRQLPFGYTTLLVEAFEKMVPNPSAIVRSSGSSVRKIHTMPCSTQHYTLHVTPLIQHVQRCTAHPIVLVAKCDWDGSGVGWEGAGEIHWGGNKNGR